MQKKIIFFVSQSIDKRNLERFGYDIFKKKGWKIETVYIKTKKKENTLHHKNLKIQNIENIYDAIKLSKKISNSFIYNLCDDTLLQTLTVFLLLINKNMIIKRYDIIPLEKNFSFNFQKYFKKNFLNKIFYIASLKTIKMLNNLLYFYFKKKLIVCLTGKGSLKKINKYFKNKIYLHTYDYDSFLKDKKRKKLLNRDIVFIDQYEENHPDISKHGINTVTKEKYFKSLNTFFNLIEKKFKQKIIIAGHPRAKNDRKRNFQKRKIKFDQTYKLIKNSKLVLTHYSTAIYFACLLQKPILIFFTNEMKKSNYLMGCLKSFSSSLGVQNININEFDLKKLKVNLKIDKNRYNRFIKDYITMSNSKKSNHEILEQKLADLI